MTKEEKEKLVQTFVDLAKKKVAENPNAASKYLRFVQLVIGVFILVFTYNIGNLPLRLSRVGVRAQGVIVSYREVVSRPRGLFVFGNGGRRTLMPVVNFQDNGSTIEFQDWLGSSPNFGRHTGEKVTVLYDPTNASSAIIERPKALWIFYGGLTLGLLLVFQSIFARKRIPTL